MTIVRENLLTRPGYTPYCGNNHCRSVRRTEWDGEQFKCNNCDWRSDFPDEFIAEYKAKWHGEAES